MTKAIHIPSPLSGFEHQGRSCPEKQLRPWNKPRSAGTLVVRDTLSLGGHAVFGGKGQENIRLPARGTALLEDLGNLTANELYDPAGAGENAASAILEGLDQLAGQCTHLIVVSNEVFSGGADYAGDTGRYLKALAQVNNALAARADHVVRVVCGIPVYYKGVEK